MSLEAMVWALNLAPVPMDAAGARRTAQPNSACAFVLVGLANHAGPDGRDAFPGVDTLVRYTRLSERTVRTALDRLEEKGTIKPCDPDVLAAKIKRADRRPNGYDLCMDLVRDDLDTEALRGISKANPFLKPLIEQVIEQRGATAAPREPEPQERGATTAPRESERGAIGAERGATASERGAGVAPEPSLTALEPSGTPSTAAAGAPSGRLSAAVVGSTGTAAGQEVDLFGGTGATARPASPAKREPEPTFKDFWAKWPKKLDKGHAETAWAQMLKKGARPSEIIAGLDRFNEKLKRDPIDPQYIPYPATWLRGKRYEDSDEEMAASVHLPTHVMEKRAMHQSWLAQAERMDAQAEQRWAAGGSA